MLRFLLIFCACLAFPCSAAADEPTLVEAPAQVEAPVPAPAPAPAPTGAPILVIVQIEPAALAASEEYAYDGAAEDAMAYDDEALEEEALEDAAGFVPGPVSVGLSGLVGTHPRAHGLDATWTAGLDVGARVLSFLSIGARRVGVASRDGERWALHVSPYVELAYRPWERVEGYAQLGAALGVRLDDQAADVLAVAPFLDVGVRFFVLDCFSIAVEGAVHVPASGAQLFGNDSFPKGAVIFQGGAALAFHFG